MTINVSTYKLFKRIQHSIKRTTHSHVFTYLLVIANIEHNKFYVSIIILLSYF